MTNRWPAFFVGLRFQIGDRRYTLDEIEQGVLLQHAEATKSDVKFYRIVGAIALDLRMHFARVCGAMGRPKLDHETYAADRIEAQLDDTARRFVNDRGRAALDRRLRRMCVSRISQWYAKDFADPRSNPRAGSIAEFLSRHVSDAVPASRLAGGAVAEPRNLGDDLLRLRLEAQPSIAHPAVRTARVVNGTLAVAPSPRGPRGGDGATSAHGDRAAPDARRYGR
ncbi:MAG: DUF547 domain-containing protein, partial [Planctomycetes bacterium]|nr:DUF547 domain-containing protein [Planctomycetota bacterium]